MKKALSLSILIFCGIWVKAQIVSQSKSCAMHILPLYIGKLKGNIKSINFTEFPATKTNNKWVVSNYDDRVSYKYEFTQAGTVASGIHTTLFGDIHVKYYYSNLNLSYSKSTVSGEDFSTEIYKCKNERESITYFYTYDYSTKIDSVLKYITTNTYSKNMLLDQVEEVSVNDKNRTKLYKIKRDANDNVTSLASFDNGQFAYTNKYVIQTTGDKGNPTEIVSIEMNGQSDTTEKPCGNNECPHKIYVISYQYY